MSVDDSCKLFVAGLPDSVSEAVLRELFEATGGTVVDVSLPRDRSTGRPRGFGFVTLSSQNEAQAARESLDGSTQAGRTISVRPFQASGSKRGVDEPSEPNSDDRTLYLGNLPYDASVAEVEGLLGERGAGPVARVHLPQDGQGRARGFGFVTFRSVESAQAAVEALQDCEMKGRKISASIARSRPERASRPPPAGKPSPRPRPRNDGAADARPYRTEAPAPFVARETFDEPRRGERKRKEPKKKKRLRDDRGKGRRDREGLRSPRASRRLEDDD